MKISCEVAEDLLPLFVENSCSDDSKKLLDEHLKMCPVCKKKYERMKNDDFFVDTEEKTDKEIALLSYAKKIRCRRMILSFLIPLMILLVGFASSITYEACKLMLSQDEKPIVNVEKDVYNLAAKDIECNIDEITQYDLYAPASRIVVSLQSENFTDGSIVKLYRNEDVKEEVMIAEVSQRKSECIFRNLIPGISYSIKIEGVKNGTVVVSETLSFRQAVALVLKDMF